MSPHTAGIGSSPSFARAAEQLIAVQEFDAAITICAEGVKQYPEYSTGYLMLAQAYEGDGRLEEARRVAAVGLKYAPGSSALKGVGIERVAVEAAPSTPEPDEEEIASTRELETLAEQLSSARMPAIDPSIPIENTTGDAVDLPVTATLARIYEAQGLLNEAIAAYTALAEMGDEKSELYREKIASLLARKRNPGTRT